MPEQENELIGKLFGNYRVVRELGRGGMGIVYLAHELALDRPVALKMLPAMLAIDQDYVDRFYREAKTAAKLQHPNVVTVHAVGSCNGRHFIAMEYVQGKTLADEIKKSAPMEVHRALRIAGQIAAALGAAQGFNIIHRDIKPANIMLDKEGHAKVMDFGVAKIQVEGDIASTAGMVGTLTYMSPEQCRSQPGDHRSDIYALGAVLFEMLTGRPPYADPSHLQLMMKIIEEPLPSIGKLVPRVPPGVVMIVERALAKDPERRFNSGAELKDAIDQCFADGGVRQPAAKFARPDAGDVKAPKPAPAPKRPSASPAALKAAGRRGGIALACLALLAAAGWLGRGLFIPRKELLVDFHGHTEGVSCVRFSPDGVRLLSGGGDGKLLLWNSSTGDIQKAFSGHQGWIYALAVSPQNRHAISGGFDQTIRLWGITSGIELRKMSREDEGGLYHVIKGLAYSPDGAYAVSGAYDKTVRLWDVEKVTELKRFLGHEGPVECVAYSADGSTIASGSGDKTARLWHVSGDKEFRKLSGHSASVNAVAISGDASRVLTGSIDGSARLWDAATGQELRRVEGFPLGIFAVALSADGKTALLGAGDGKVLVYDAELSTLRKTFLGHRDAVWTVAISPDGKLAASGSLDKSVKVWNLESMK